MENLNEQALLDQTYEYDPEAALNPNVMVPDGWNLAQVKLGKLGIETKQKAGRAYLRVHLQAQIIAPGARFDKRNISDWPTSIVFDSSNTSLLHVGLREAGFTVPARGTIGQLKSAIEQVFGGDGAQLDLRTRWEAEVNMGTKEASEYETVAKGMKEFPPAINPATGQTIPGEFNPTITLGDSYGHLAGTQVEARERIKDFAKPSTKSVKATQSA